MPKFLIVHHAGGTGADPHFDTSHQTFWSVENWHRQWTNYEAKYKSPLGYWCAYNYIIDKSGYIKKARNDWEYSWHCKGRNNDIGILLIGNFSRIGSNNRPSEAQKKALAKLLAELCEEYDIPTSRIVPHRKFRSTDCFGTNLEDDWARKVAEEYINKRNLIKKKISLLEKLIQLYILLLNRLRGGKDIDD